MRSPVLLFVLLLLAAPATLARAQQSPALGGFVTTPGTTAFQVNAVPVVCDPAVTTDRLVQAHQVLRVKGCPARILGDSITVYGRKDKQAGTVHATAVETDAPVDLAVDGFALIDRILQPIGHGTGTLRADGYALTLTPATAVTFAQGSGLTLGTITTNLWVRYTGTLHPNGTVTASSLLLSPNLIKPSEDKLRTKSDFDAAAVTEDDRQSSGSRFFLGRKARQIPASHDEAAQQRISAIGTRLVPAYQRQLPAADPTRIDFRFQLVDDRTLRTTLSSPSGVIQVPEFIPAALADDSQLAAILAAAVAEVLEKQTLRAIPPNNARTAASIAGNVAGVFVPGLGLATNLATSKNASIAQDRQEEQSVRTALPFLQDAGFDPTQAPIAWWTLSTPKPKPLAQTRLPHRTQYLYKLLSTTHRPTQQPPATQ